MRCTPYQLLFLARYFVYVILMNASSGHKVEETVSSFNIRQFYFSIKESKTTHQVSFHSFDSQSMFLYCLADLEVDHHQLQQNTCQVHNIIYCILRSLASRTRSSLGVCSPDAV